MLLLLQLVLLLYQTVNKGCFASGSYCELGEFSCNSGSNGSGTSEGAHVCLPQVNICDGIEDCPNASDEQDCDDRNFDLRIDEMFRKNPHAEHDDLNQTCILNYSGGCFCRHKDILCHHQNLLKVPKNLPDDIDILDFTGNNFKVLTNRTFEALRDVRTLVLRHCEIDEISPYTFYNLSSIEILYLDNNNISTITHDLFRQENYLDVLIIRYNEIWSININAFQHLNRLSELDLSHNKLTVINEIIFRPLQGLIKLNLEGNHLNSVNKDSFPELKRLTTLYLSNNKIDNIEAGTFEKLDHLYNLFLSNNKLSHLHNGSFASLLRLKTLSLDGNSITNIETGVFLDCNSMDSLDLRNNKFNRLEREVLQALQNLSHIYFERLENCIDAPHVRVCEPKSDGISSQEHLLDSAVLRASVWVMATVGFLGNMVVLLGRGFMSPTHNVVHSLYIRNLAISDLLMTIYLVLIAAADIHYRGVYLQNQWRWRHNMCNLCGFLNTLSSESSVLILSLVTWDRFVSITQPLGRKQPSVRVAIITLLMLWSVSALIAYIPVSQLVTGYFGSEFYSSNGVCLPLFIHDPYAQGWIYSMVMLMCVNALALLFICFAYYRMIREIRISTVACRSSSTHRHHSVERDRVAHRFALIVLTDCLCWLPIIVMKIMALSGLQPSQSYQRFLYAFLAIYILPINSALNPVLYTITTKAFNKQMKKFYDACIYCKEKRKERQHSGYDSAFSLSLSVFQKGNSARRVLTYRDTQSSIMPSKNSFKRSVV